VTDPHATPAPAPAPTPAPAPQTPRDRHRTHVAVVVWLGGAASIGFTLLMIATMLGYFYFNIITSLSALENLAYIVWPIICLIEINLQVWPMIVRRQVGGNDVLLDYATSFIPMVGWCVVGALALFGVLHLNKYGSIIFAESFLVALAELTLMFLSYHLIAAARDEQH
jgi:hypothetical protein